MQTWKKLGIRVLKGLRSLALEVLICTVNGIVWVDHDLVFPLGIGRLPVLNPLVLKGSFGIGEDIAEEWCGTGEGRRIEIEKVLDLGDFERKKKTVVLLIHAFVMIVIGLIWWTGEDDEDIR